MTTLIHGDDIGVSRQALNANIHRAQIQTEIRRINGADFQLTDLVQALESPSLFSDGVTVVVENLFGSLTKKAKLMAQVFTLIGQNPKVNLIIWENRELAKSVIDRIPGPKSVSIFKIPVVIFRFLDSLVPQNPGISSGLLAQCCQTEAAEIIFTLVTKRVRQLIICKDGQPLPGLADWQLSRLTNQAQLFTMEKLLVMYRNLGEIDYQIKSGQSPFSLRQHLELFIANL